MKKILFLLLSILISTNLTSEPAPSSNEKNWYSDFIFNDNSFVFEFIRTLGSSYTGGADLGESVSTATKINSKDTVAWHREWLNTANRLNQVGDKMEKEGHSISATETYLRASNYYRTAGFYAVSKEERPKAIQAWEQSRNVFLKAIKRKKS